MNMEALPITQRLSGFKLKKACEKCQREITVTNFKRHHVNCNGLQQKQKRHVSLEKIKVIQEVCPNCQRTFKNIFSMSAHKGHCLGLSDTTHLEKFRTWNKGKVLSNVAEIFSENSRFCTGHVKKTLIKLALKDWQCELCGIAEWQNKAIVLELDHINGKNRDHRIENIRFLCPNCHSQTFNFRGRNINTGKKVVSDETLLDELKKSNIRQSLLNVGMAASGKNYERCKKLLGSITIA